jgi:hypothetical protein
VEGPHQAGRPSKRLEHGVEIDQVAVEADARSRPAIAGFFDRTSGGAPGKAIVVFHLGGARLLEHGEMLDGPGESDEDIVGVYAETLE